MHDPSPISHLGVVAALRGCALGRSVLAGRGSVVALGGNVGLAHAAVLRRLVRVLGGLAVGAHGLGAGVGVLLALLAAAPALLQADAADDQGHDDDHHHHHGHDDADDGRAAKALLSRRLFLAAARAFEEGEAVVEGGQGERKRRGHGPDEQEEVGEELVA